MIVHARGDRATNSGAASEYRFVIFRGSPSMNPTFVAPPFENLSLMNYYYYEYIYKSSLFYEVREINKENKKNKIENKNNFFKNYNILLLKNILHRKKIQFV